MPVLYGGYAFVPAETCDFSLKPTATEDGRPLGSTVVATITGELIPAVVDGVPVPIGSDQYLTHILLLQKAMRAALSTPGQILECQGWDGSLATKLVARLDSLDFEPATNWFNRCRYTAVFVANGFAGDTANPATGITRSEEKWGFAEENRQTVVTHTVAASAVVSYPGDGTASRPGWQVARDWVQTQLGLGWTAVGGFSPTAGPVFAAASAAWQSGTTAWNHTTVDEIDEGAGGYTATETWTLSNQPYWVEQTASVTRAAGEAGSNVAVTLSGTIHGLYLVQGDYATGLANALIAWPTVLANLFTTAQSYVGSDALCSNPREAETSPDPERGTLGFTVAYNDRVVTNGTTEVYKIQEKAAIDAATISVAISGTITGELVVGQETDNSLKFSRAQAQFARIRGSLFARVAALTGIAGLQLAPLDATSELDPVAGTVTYEYTFDDRLLRSVILDTRVSRESSRQDARSYVTISGTIRGLRTDPFATPANPLEKLDTAIAYWESIENGLLNLAGPGITISDLQTDPIKKRVEYALEAGTVSFESEYMTGVRLFPTAQFENISVSTSDPLESFVDIDVPGRGSLGPVSQNLQVTKLRRTVATVELIFANPGGVGVPPAPIIDMTQFAPSSFRYVSDGGTTWLPTEGRLTRTVTWTI